MVSRWLGAAMLLAVLISWTCGAAAGVDAAGPSPRLSGGIGHDFGTPVAPAVVVRYSQPAAGTGALLQSSHLDPNGTDFDQYVWDNFTLPIGGSITEVRWRGGFDPARGGSGGPVADFSVAFYPSIPGGTQPDVAHPLLQDLVGGDASQTPAGTFGGVALYDYAFALRTPFAAQGGTKYWVQIEAYQHNIPDWGIAAATGGDGRYFRRIASAGDIFYQIVPGDAAFALLGQGSKAWLPIILHGG